MKATYKGMTPEQIEWPQGTDPRPLLIVGRKYIVTGKVQYPNYTTFELKDVKGEFNSAFFVDVTRY